MRLASRPTRVGSDSEDPLGLQGRFLSHRPNYDARGICTVVLTMLFPLSLSDQQLQAVGTRDDYINQDTLDKFQKSFSEREGMD